MYQLGSLGSSTEKELEVQFIGEASMKDKSKKNCIEQGKPSDLTKSWPTHQGALEQRLSIRLCPLLSRMSWLGLPK